MMNCPQYSQLDVAWKNYPLGTTTIGSYGCTITCLSMALSNWGIQMTPPQVVDALNKAGGLTSDGLILWTSISAAFPTVNFHFRWYTTLESPVYANRQDVYAAIITVKHLLALGQPVVMKISQAPHWVLAVDWSPQDNDFVIHDPNGGKRILLGDKYGPAIACLYGYAVLIGAPTAFPDGTDLPTLQKVAQSAGAGVWKATQIQEGQNVATYAKELVDTFL